jgi:peptidyl-prolyl cis-trans isomerase D
MSVMEKLRSGTDSTAMQVLLALVVFSFVLWYNPLEGDQAQFVARVNGQPITDSEFMQAYRVAEYRAGRNLDDAQREELRAQVKQELVEEAIILQEAERLGLTVSGREIARAVLANTEFHGPDGKHDPELYVRVLKSRRLTRAVYEDDLRKRLLREKMRLLVFRGASISEPVLKEWYVDQNTKINLKYVRVRPSVFIESEAVTPEARQAWLANNAARVDETYQRDLPRLYDIPDKVQLQVIKLEKRDDGEDVAARMAAIRAELAAGADFEALARRWSEDVSVSQGGDMGMLAVGALQPAVAEVVSKLEIGQLSEVVDFPTDVRVFKVVAREPGRVIPLEEVRDAIADRLIGEEEAPTRAARFAEETLAAWKAAGVPPEDKLNQPNLRTSETGLISLTGEGTPMTPPEKMLKQAKGQPVGAVLPEVYMQGDVLWIGQVLDVVEADEAAYATERDELREQVLFERRIAFYRAWVDDARERAVVQ